MSEEANSGHVAIDIQPADRRPQMSSLATSHFRYDDDLLHRAVRDAARYAYGTVMVELWVGC